MALLLQSAARPHWHCTWWLIQQQNIGGDANITFITCLMYLCSNIRISTELIRDNILCLPPTHLAWPSRAVRSSQCVMCTCYMWLN